MDVPASFFILDHWAGPVMRLMEEAGRSPNRKKWSSGALEGSGSPRLSIRCPQQVGYEVGLLAYLQLGMRRVGARTGDHMASMGRFLG